MCVPNPCKNPTPVCEAAGDGLNYTCSCNETSCGAGKTCVGGTCYNCEKGEKCDCSGNQVSDGNGGCYTPNDSCNPNPCPSETPSCSALDETQYSCSCTSDSCPDGKECSDMACQNCSAGDDCGCSKYGKEADGNGGCRCPGMKIDDGAGGCVCPSCYESDGTWGGCRKTCECVSCPDAQKCVDGACVNCPLGEDCGCFDDDAYSNGSGMCEPNDPCDGVSCGNGQYCSGGNCYCYEGTWNGSECYVEPEDPCADVSCTGGRVCSNGECICTTGTWNGSTCYVEPDDPCATVTCESDEYCSEGTCYPSPCPSGYDTSVTSCPSGQKLETNGTSGGRTCGKCITLTSSCPSGYSTSVRDCYGLPGSWQLETNGASGGVACGKCVPIPCPTDVINCNSGHPGFEMSYGCKMSGSNQCYSCCSKNCPPGSKLEMNPTSVNTPGYCPSGKTPKMVGYSGFSICVECV